MVRIVAVERLADPARAPVLCGDEQRVVNHVWSADWSPDGSRIAFSAEAGDQRVIGYVRMDGGATGATSAPTPTHRSPCAGRQMDDGWLSC